MQFYEMSTRIAKLINFSQYDYVEDLVNTGYLRCIEVAHKFNLERNNPFAYFTSVIRFRFIDYIKAENKQKTVKINLKEFIDLGFLINDEVEEEG